MNKATADTGAIIPLFIAAQNGFGDAVEELITAKAGVNKAAPTNGATPLFIAAQDGHLDIVCQNRHHTL